MPDARGDSVVDPFVRLAQALAGENADRRASRALRPPSSRSHHLAEAPGDDRAPALGEQAADLLGPSLVLGAASDHRYLHGAMVEARRARGGTLVLGGGFAGSYVARLLGRRGATIVSLENFMLFTPLLPEAASGTLEPRHVVVPLRMMCPHAELLLGRLSALDTERQTATVETGAGTFEVGYEQAVLALGSVARVLPIPGLAEHGLGFKDLADAINLRNHVLRQLEAAMAAVDRNQAEAHLTFVFVGAGYAGVEALASSPTSSETRCATIRSSRGTARAGSSSTPRRRSSPRFRRGSATMPRSSWREEASRSGRRRRSSRSGRPSSSSPEASAFPHTRSSGLPVSARTRSWPSSDYPSTSGGA